MIIPHGGELINTLAEGAVREELLRECETLPKITIEDRYVSDCEMIAIGGFSPLKGFMDSAAVDSVVESMALPGGPVWAIPIVLPLHTPGHAGTEPGSRICLLDKGDRAIALMEVSETFSLDLENLCLKVFKTSDTAHPGVKAFMDGGNTFLAGEITLLNRPERENIDAKYFRDPLQVRGLIDDMGWQTVVAFQTRNPIHRAHEYLLKCAAEPHDGLLIHPLVGETKSDDIPADIRMTCYEVLVDNYFPGGNTLLSVLPAAMRYAGPREAVHHMIMRKNYGCTHMIIGRDHAGTGEYYGTYEAQEFVREYADRLGIKPINFEHSFYCNRCKNMASKKTCPHPGEDHLFLSGTKVRAMLQDGLSPPVEFTRPEVARILVDWATSG